MTLPPRLHALLATPQGRALLAAGASGALLAAAFAFQYIGGLAPCPLCLVQRWPHAALVALAPLVWYAQRTQWLAAVLWAGAALAFAAFATAALHTGVELGFWASPLGCGLPDWSDPNLAARLGTSTPADCTQPAWTFLGHSMATWNALASSTLMGIWTGAAVAVGRQKA